MPERPINILLIHCSGEDTPKMVAAGSGDAVATPFTQVENVDDAIFRIDRETVDLVLLDVGRRGVAGLADIARIRERSPDIPLIVLAEGAGDDLKVEALRAGAQDCLPRGEPLPSQLSRAVRFAIERKRFRSVEERERDEAGRMREVQELQAICGPQPLPVTENSLGVQALALKSPKDFEELIAAYSRVLDQVLERQHSPSERTRQKIEDALNRIADRLGMLNAGPRDVIDLHKAAIARKIDGHASRRAAGLVEEGRLVILQLMGQLVSFYRALSWGLRIDVRPRPNRLRDAQVSDNKPRDR